MLNILDDVEVANRVYSNYRAKLWSKLGELIASLTLDSPMTGIESRLKNDPIVRGKFQTVWWYYRYARRNLSLHDVTRLKTLYQRKSA